MIFQFTRKIEKAPQDTDNDAQQVGVYEVNCTVLHLYANREYEKKERKGWDT